MKTAVITGASGGIGSAIARRLAKDGFTVVVGYHTAADRAEELVAGLSGYGHRAAHISILDPASLEELARSLQADPGQVDVLVNCAGVTRSIPHDDLDGLDDDLINEIFATNWRGPFGTIRALRPLLDAAENAVVVNISSVAGVTGQGSNCLLYTSPSPRDATLSAVARWA